MSSKLCPFCMQMTEGDTCSHCGKNVNYAGSPAHLPAGYVVSGKHPYVLGAALGQGGFGITYLALDMVTNQRVAIKEYYPTYCSARTSHSNVTAYSNQEDVYAKGKERFLNEAQTLKSLSDLEHIVNVLDFFEANNSAYLVMEFLEGSSLKDYAVKHGVFPAQKFLTMLKPLMEDIHRMHERGVIHRDIAPDNIILLPDGQMKLIDFGAARSYVGSKSMTMVVKKGYAPVEQYMSKGSSASTDVYALSASIYYCITGKVPTDSAERQYDDVPLESPIALGADITPKQEQAMLQALSIQQKERIQTVQEFLAALEDESIPAAPAVPPVQAEAKPEAGGKTKTKKPLSKKTRLAILAAAAAVLILVVSLFLFSGRDTAREGAGAAAMQPVSGQTTAATEPEAATEAAAETAAPEEETVVTEPVSTEPTYGEDEFESPMEASAPVSSSSSAESGGGGGGSSGGGGGSSSGGGSGGFWPFPWR